MVPTWLHVGVNMGPCWLKKTILARLGPSWALLGGSCGGLGGVLGLQESPEDSREAPGSSGEAPGVENDRFLWGPT